MREITIIFRIFKFRRNYHLSPMVIVSCRELHGLQVLCRGRLCVWRGRLCRKWMCGICFVGVRCIILGQHREISGREELSRGNVPLTALCVVRY